MSRIGPGVPPSAGVDVELPAHLGLASLVPWVRRIGLVLICLTVICNPVVVAVVCWSSSAILDGLVLRAGDDAGLDAHGLLPHEVDRPLFMDGWGLAATSIILWVSVTALPATSLIYGSLVLAWVYRAVRIMNLRRSAAQPHRPALVVCGFLLPIIRVFSPYLTMRALWLRSEPAAPRDAPRAPAPPTGELALWWASRLVGHATTWWIVGGLLRWWVDRWPMDVDTLVAYILSWFGADLLGDAAKLVEIRLEISLLSAITVRLSHKRTRRSQPLASA